jgi:CBS domain-containing protein
MLTAQDIMTTEVVTVTPDMPVQELAQLLVERQIGGVPVLDGERLIGVVTENDLIDQAKRLHIPTVLTILDAFIPLESPKRLDHDLRKMTGTTVGDICSRELLTVTRDATMEEIATIMAEQRVHTLPVLHEGRLAGVIGKRDLLRVLARQS